MKIVAKRLLLFVALLGVIALGVMITGVYLARAEPAFYHVVAMSADQFEAAAQRATEKFATIQNRVARLSAAYHAAQRAESRGGATMPASQPVDPIVISFSADELNAFFEKWSTFNNWKSTYASYVTDPLIVLQDHRLIIAGKSTDLGLLVSLHFEPAIDPNGQLQLRLVRILGGRLPLPKLVIEKWEARATQALAARLPNWQRQATFDSDGAANPSLIAASSAMLLFHVLRDEPAEPLLFLPVVGQKGSVPVQITDVKIDDDQLTLTVNPIGRDARAALLKRLTTANLNVPPAQLSSR